jgi:superfamily II DNA or RNA helicase
MEWLEIIYLHNIFLKSYSAICDTNIRLTANIKMLSWKWNKINLLLQTHAQLTFWLEKIEAQGPDLTGKLLVIDEAHHCGDGITKLNEFMKNWQELGGQVLLITATPFRTDEAEVIPDNFKTFKWSIVDHSQGGYAPKNFNVKTVLTQEKVDTAAEFFGDVINNQNISFKPMIDVWLAEGKPKAVFIVPSINSIELSGKLQKELEKHNARVVNAVGVDKKTTRKFNEALEKEQKAAFYAESTVDIFIACKRFDEGTDWSMCSHVYSWGVPRSFGLVQQRWGRTFRSKQKYIDYPKSFRESACITFFITQIRDKKELSNKHREHCWLLSTFLADWEIAKKITTGVRFSFAATLRRAAAQNRSENQMTDEEEQSIFEAENQIILNDKERSKAILNIAIVEQLLQDEDEPKTVENIVQKANILFDGKEVENIQSILIEQIANNHPEEQEEITNIFRNNARIPNLQINKEIKKIFYNIIDKYKDKTIDFSTAVFGSATIFTGDDAESIANQLRDALNKPDLTVEIVKKAMLAFCEDHNDYPKQNETRDATKYFGYNETWVAVDASLHKCNRGIAEKTSLFQLAKELGLAKEKPDITIEMVKKAILTFYEDHNDYPKAKDKRDATKYFGYNETWVAVEVCLNHCIRGITEKTSLFQLAKELGLAKEKSDITIEMVKKAMLAFYEDHNDYPTKSKDPIDATKYFGYNETWKAVEGCLNNCSRGITEKTSLSKLAKELGLVKVKPNLAIEMVKKAMLAFYEDHNDYPKQNETRDATKYFGYNETWKAVDACLKQCNRGIAEKTSLSKLAKELGLAKESPDITIEMVKKAMLAFYEDHNDYPKQNETRDATKYFGYNETWVAVEGCLNKCQRGITEKTSLSKLAKELGLAKEKPDITIEMVKEAVLAFYADHNDYPKVKDKRDATKYFGYNETWVSVEGCLNNCSRGITEKTSLSKLAKELGLVKVKPNLAIEMVKKAMLAFYADHNGWPKAKDKRDATKYFGYNETWVAVEGCLNKCQRGIAEKTSLFQLAKELGLVKVK